METQLVNEIRDVFKLQLGTDKIPNVIPVVDLNPKHARISNFFSSNSRETTGTLTIGTTRSDVDTYINGIGISVVKNSLCDLATGSLATTITVDGLAVNLIRTQTLTLTAERIDVNLIFPDPIKLDKGSVISLNGSFAAGAMSRGGYVVGFIVDNNRA